MATSCSSGESPLHILAFDVETPGCHDPLFAVGAVVLNTETDEVVARLKAYNYDPSYVTFEPRCWDFWGKPSQAEVLRAMTVRHASKDDFDASQKSMVRSFFAFKTEWQSKLGSRLMIITDTAGFDQEVMNTALVACGLENEYMPLPYNNGARRRWTREDSARLAERDPSGVKPLLRSQVTTAPYGLIRSSTSMMHGFLLARGIVAFDEPVWGVSKKFYNAFPDLPKPPVHSHLPDEDAHGIAHTLSQMLKVSRQPFPPLPKTPPPSPAPSSVPLHQYPPGIGPTHLHHLPPSHFHMPRPSFVSHSPMLGL